MATWVTYNTIAFNAEINAEKSLQAFSEHEAHHGLSAEEIKEIHTLCKKAVGKQVKAPKAKEVPTSQEEATAG